jgi:predicted nucleic acid-binding protein
MRVDKVVVNASPLILLFKTELSNVLPSLFSEILVPEAVREEVSEKSKDDKAAKLLNSTDWVNFVDVPPRLEIIRWDLGPGETSVLSYSIAFPEYRPLIDDAAAKKCAAAHGISTLGTGSTLILAKQRGLIDSVGESLEKLRLAGLWISDPIIQMLKTKAGERSE